VEVTPEDHLNTLRDLHLWHCFAGTDNSLLTEPECGCG
jgi:hypothetical protein